MISKPAVNIVSIAVVAILVGGMTFTAELSNSEHAAPAMAAPATIPEPKFEIRWLRGQLTLEGHTQSREHEESLLAIVATLFPDSTPLTSFEPLGLVPPHWIAGSVQALRLLAETNSAKAMLSADALRVNGVTSNDSGWHDRVSAVRSALPGNLSISARAMIVNTDISVPAVCERAFADLDTGAIRFKESTAEFRPSAYPRLERIVSLARACKDARVDITGHTDGSGDALFNQQLSLARARAVGDYFSDGGVDHSRLVIAGAGAAQPIADNGTRYGRSLNRRIDISLHNDAR